MNILLINHYAGSPTHGMEYRPYYLAREWVRAGHSVRILAASVSHVRTNQPEMRSERQDEVIDGIAYTWFKTPEYAGNGLGRIRNILAFMRAVWRSSKEWANEFKPDVVIASSTYPMDIWPAERIARMAGARLVYEVHDLWPLSPMELGGLSKWHPFIMWVQWAEDKAYRVADKVVSMLPKTLPYMQSRGLNPDKWCCVPNGFDLAEWEQESELPSSLAQVISGLRATGLPLVGYAGSQGMANALDTLLDAAHLLRQKAHIVLLGHGPETARLMNRVQAEGLENVHFLGSLPKASIPAFLRTVDIAYIGWRPNPLYRFGISPNKLMDYMMAARPVVHSVEAGNDVVREAGCGLSVPPASATEVATAVETLAALSPVERQKMGERGQAFVKAHHDYRVLADTMLGHMKVNP